MSVTRREIAATAQQVFGVLADPASYGDWVVGSDAVRDADAGWPAVGSRFHHRVGAGPLKVNDHTEVLECEPPKRLVLRARARPLGTALVRMTLDPRGDRTLVTMQETAGDPLSRLVLNPLTDWLTDRRNRISLGRLERLARSENLQS